MPRPRCRRNIEVEPACSYFKPVGIPLRNLDEIVLLAEELEAMRLADLEGLYRIEAARKMGVSRQTFDRIVRAARKKTTLALVKGHALRVDHIDP